MPLVVSFACGHAARPPVLTSPTPQTTRTPAPRKTDPPPPGLVDVDPRITVELRYATADNFTGAPLPGYDRADRGLLRPPAAAALHRVEDGLVQQGLSLRIFDAYRPVRASVAMVAWAHRVHRDDLVGPYIAAHSEHNLGTAVDLTLERNKAPLDMGTPFDTFSSAAHYANATGVALADRKMLRDAMVAAGFGPYDEEWWHFSYPVPGATALDVPIR